MPDRSKYVEIYRYALDALDKRNMSRDELILAITDSFCLTDDELCDFSLSGVRRTLRSTIGTVLTEMERKGVIARGKDGAYKRASEKYVAIREEECEEEILKLVSASPKSKADIKDSLVAYFGTDATSTVKDDNKLFTYTGQILKRLVADKIFDFDGAIYSIAPEKSAFIKSRAEMLDLKAAFLNRVHSKGGEFFEYYFLNLLTRYLTRTGKTVIDGHVTGGSDDGGIDAIVRTIDALGFRETIMVQTKNRRDTMNETDIRGFYGAVCAQQGSRGIFATTSSFHPMAAKFLNGIDNCVGVDGDKIFSMACDTSYGIRRDGDRLTIDNDII